MKFRYKWNNKEANFAKPVKFQVKGGTHITFEIILKYKNKFVALRRQSIPGHESPPGRNKNLLYFCHGLIHYGESVEQCVKRIVNEQCGLKIKSYKVVYIDSNIQRKDSQWAIIPHVIADLAALPKLGMRGNEIKEVVVFSKDKIPNDFAWWSKRELSDFLAEFV